MKYRTKSFRLCKCSVGKKNNFNVKDRAGQRRIITPARKQYTRSDRENIKARGHFDNIMEREQRTLGHLLWKPEILTRVRNFLTPSSFRYERHQLIFSAMLNVVGQGLPIDEIPLWEFLSDRGQLDKAGGSMYLTYLTQITFWEVRS